MASDGLVSVVIPTYEPQTRFLRSALESVLNQSHRRLEAIVVHDGSEKILQVIGRFSADERLQPYAEKGRGYIAALNQGIELSRGDCISFCDSDDTLNEHHIKVLAETLRKFPDAGVAFDNLTYVFDSSNAEDHGLNSRSEVHGKPLISSERAMQFAKSGVTLQDVFMDNLISGPAFMVPRAVFDRVGLFDENAFLVNDLHLFYRIGAHYSFRYVDYMGVLKRVHSANLTTTHPHYEFGVRSLENIRQCYPEVYRRVGKRVFNKKLARKYYRLGLYNERQGNPLEAKEMYRNAMLTRKFSLRYHWAYLRSALFQ
jgi:glycosyltransferase involved in cell wall biosynthesis